MPVRSKMRWTAQEGQAPPCVVGAGVGLEDATKPGRVQKLQSGQVKNERLRAQRLGLGEGSAATGRDIDTGAHGRRGCWSGRRTSQLQEAALPPDARRPKATCKRRVGQARASNRAAGPRRRR